MDGVTATKQICSAFPDTKILVFTTLDDDEYVSHAIQNGAIGYLLKDTPIEELTNAIRSAYQGYTQFSPGLIKKVLRSSSIRSKSTPKTQLAELTAREREVLS